MKVARLPVSGSECQWLSSPTDYTAWARASLSLQLGLRHSC